MGKIKLQLVKNRKTLRLSRKEEKGWWKVSRDIKTGEEAFNQSDIKNSQKQSTINKKTSVKTNKM